MSKNPAIGSLQNIQAGLGVALGATVCFAWPAYAQGEPAVSPWLSQLFLFGSFGLIFYMLIIRPQQKRQREAAALLGSLKSGDKVVTNGGMIGTITDLREDRVFLKVANDVRVEFQRSAITGKADA